MVYVLHIIHIEDSMPRAAAGTIKEPVWAEPLLQAFNGWLGSSTQRNICQRITCERLLNEPIESVH